MITKKEQDLINKAIKIIEREMASSSDIITCTKDASKLAQLHLASLKRECFAILHLNSQNMLIELEKHSFGTIDQANVYPREVVRSCLEKNTRSVIFSHNHPSGSTEPSEADKNLTRKLTQALELIDVRVLDHIIVGQGTLSFAECGLL